MKTMIGGRRDEEARADPGDKTLAANDEAEIGIEQHPRARRPLTDRQRGYRVAVLTLLILTGVWRLVAMVQWSWMADDWLFVERVPTLPIRAYLTQIHNGHLQPGQFAIVWAITTLDPLNFGWAIAALWTMSMASLIVWALVFRQLLGERWAAVIGLIPVALAPGFVPIILWFAAGLTIYSLQLFLGLTLLCSLGWIRQASRRRLILTVVSYVVGLAFWEKGLLSAIPVVGVALLLARHESGRIAWRRVSTLAAALAIPAVIYTGIYLAALRASGPAATSWVTRGFGDVAIFFWSSVTQNLIPALTGGPWPATTQVGSGLLLPTTAAQWLAGAVVLGLLVWGLSRRRHGWIPVATSILYVSVSMGLVIFSSRFEFAGLFAAFDPRYSADSLVVVALMGTLLLVPAVGERNVLRHEGPGARGLHAWVAPATAVALLAIALGTNSAVWDGMRPRSPKPWVDTLLADARAAGPRSVLDSNAPPNVLNAYLAGDAAKLSHMLAILRLPIAWNVPAHVMLAATPQGNLREAVVGTTTTSQPGPVPGCGYLVRPGRTIEVPMTSAAFDWSWGLELAYYSREGGTLLVKADHQTVTMALPPGLSSVQASIVDSVSHLTISSTRDSGAICVGAVRVGLMAPPDAAPPTG